MATVRETLQAKINALVAKTDALKAQLDTTDPDVQSVLGKEMAEVTAVMTVLKDGFNGVIPTP